MTKAQLRKARFASKRMSTMTPTPNYYRPTVNRELSDVRQWSRGSGDHYEVFTQDIKRYKAIHVYQNDTIPYHLQW